MGLADTTTSMKSKAGIIPSPMSAGPNNGTCRRFSNWWLIAKCSSPLITHRFPIDQAQSAYALMMEGKAPYIAMVITYPSDHARTLPRTITMGKGTGWSSRHDGHYRRG